MPAALMELHEFYRFLSGLLSALEIMDPIAHESRRQKGASDECALNDRLLKCETARPVCGTEMRWNERSRGHVSSVILSFMAVQASRLHYFLSS